MDVQEKKLVDGQEYWLGATWGTFCAKDLVFLLGNCFVRVGETIYRDWQVAQ